MDHQKQNSNQISFALPSPVQKTRMQADRTAFGQRGSALLVCLSVMPLVISAVIATIAILWFLNVKNELLYLCEVGLLETQNHLVVAENKLLQLNSPIKMLVEEKRFLTRALALSPTPAERVVIQSQLIKIKLQLAIYQKKQISLRLAAQAQSQLTLQKVTSSLDKRLRHLQKQWASRPRAFMQKTHPAIHLTAKRIDTLATIYEVPADFEKKQTQTLHWTLQGSSLFPRWVQFLHSKKFYWQDSCSSRPQKKENHTWTSELGAETSSSKHFY